jgi:hypothetical protein
MMKRNLWRLWALALGEKAHKKDHVADQVAILRSVIFTTYLVTNCFIVAGVIRHWNGRQINVQVEIYETPNNSEIIHTKGWHNLGVDRNTRIEGVYHSGTIKNRTGEFE